MADERFSGLALAGVGGLGSPASLNPKPAIQKHFLNHHKIVLKNTRKLFEINHRISNSLLQLSKIEPIYEAKKFKAPLFTI